MPETPDHTVRAELTSATTSVSEAPEMTAGTIRAEDAGMTTGTRLVIANKRAAANRRAEKARKSLCIARRLRPAAKAEVEARIRQDRTDRTMPHLAKTESEGTTLVSISMKSVLPTE